MVRSRSRTRALTLVVLAALVVPIAPARAERSRSSLPLPNGFRLARALQVAPGLAQYRVKAKRQRITIARIAPGAGFRPVVAVAKQSVGPDGGRASTSAMCRAHRCLVGVNGDFYYSYGRTAGAVVVDGEPWATRRYQRPHLIVAEDGSFRTGPMGMPMHLRVRYPHRYEVVDETTGSEFTDDRVEDLTVHRINGPRKKGKLFVYTHRYGRSTGTNPKGVELVARVVSHPQHLQVGSTASIELAEFHEHGDAPLVPGAVVLSGRGRAGKALRQLWDDVAEGTARPLLKLRIGGPHDAEHVLGGRPVLLRNGKLQKQAKDWFSRVQTARTIAAWKDDGTLFLITIDRRGKARGMSLRQAARFARALGADGAINLDGGGSTTFVRRGVVRNEPRGSERRVATALLVVRD